MPLDLKKVITQFKTIEHENSHDQNKNRLEATYRLFQEGCKNENELQAKIKETQSTKGANFYFAEPVFNSKKNERLDTLTESNISDNFSHISIATDGSQIIPSSHEFTNTCLINIGVSAIPYYEKSLPVLLTSEPTIYSSIDNIYPNSVQSNIQEEDLISYERTLKEIEGLVKIAKEYSTYKIPVIALLDGTLIHWHIEKFNSFFIEQFINRFSKALFELKELNIPIGSFVSNSRSNDLINMLRIYKCPYESVDCKKYCANIDSKNLPCNPIIDYKPVLDRRLIENIMLEKRALAGTRTILFKSNSKILNLYPDDLKIFFFYINTGKEIGRVEFPSYVANDNKLLDLLHNAIAFQCKVGFGYPVTLSEAHLQAVVGKADRQIFYQLIKEHLLKTSQTPVKISSKELKKRVSFV